MELFKVDFGLTIWMFVAFAVLFFVLAKYAWPAITKGMEQRANLIDKGVEYAQEVKEQLDNAKVSAQALIDEARRQQADIIAEANKLKNQMVEDAREEAKREARKEIDAAKLAIEQSKKEAEKSLRDQVSRFALEIAGQVTRTQLKDMEKQQSLVNSLLDDLEKN